MKIIHIAPVKSIAFISTPDGPSNSVLNLINAQRVNGNDVGLISSYSADGVVPSNAYYQSLINLSLMDLLFKSVFLDVIKDFGTPDVVHVHDIYNLKQLILVFQILNIGIPVYVSPRGTLSGVALLRSKFKKIIFLFVMNILVMNRINALIALNEGERKQIASQYPNKKIIIAHNGVDSHYKEHRLFYNHFRNKYESEIINIGFLGRLDVHIKGLDLLLEAYLKYQNSADKIKIKISLIGDHKTKNEFNSELYLNEFSSKLLNKSMFSISEPVFGEDKWVALSKFDILIQPSRSEGMPLTVLEAMSIGVPCIVSKQTNMGEFILKAGCGWVVDANEDSLYKIFKKVENINKIIFAKKGLNGIRYVKKFLQWNKVSQINYD